MLQTAAVADTLHAIHTGPSDNASATDAAWAFVLRCVEVITSLPYTPGKYQHCDAAMLARKFAPEVPDVT